MNSRTHDIHAVLTCLQRSPAISNDLLADIPEEMLKIRRIPSKWSIHEHVCHLADVQPMLVERLKTFAREAQPVFMPYLPGATDSDAHLIRMNLTDALAQFRNSRQELIAVAETFAPEDLDKPGQHPEYTLYTPRILLRHILMHDHLHMYRIESLWLTADAYL